MKRGTTNLLMLWNAGGNALPLCCHCYSLCYTSCTNPLLNALKWNSNEAKDPFALIVEHWNTSREQFKTSVHSNCNLYCEYQMIRQIRNSHVIRTENIFLSIFFTAFFFFCGFSRSKWRTVAVALRVGVVIHPFESKQMR